VHLAGGHLEFLLKNVRVSDDGDTPLAIAPSAAVSLSRRALLSGRIAPESVDLISPRLLLFYGEDGSLSLAFSHPGEREDGEAARGARVRSVAPAASAASNDAGDLGRIDLVKMLSQASASARKSEHAGAYLRDRHHRQRQSQEHLARARAQDRPRSSPQPQLDCRPHEDRFARRAMDRRLPHL
jgi:hypothetical protein